LALPRTVQVLPHCTGIYLREGNLMEEKKINREVMRLLTNDWPVWILGPTPIKRKSKTRQTKRNKKNARAEARRKLREK
jgi:hypothetical protein